MKLKLDENMPRTAARLFVAEGHDVSTVVDEGLSGKTDAAVARSAAAEGRLIVTLDKRFADVRKYPPGSHPGFLVIRSRDQSRPMIERLLRAFLEEYGTEDFTGCIVVLEPGAVRVRRPR